MVFIFRKWFGLLDFVQTCSSVFGFNSKNLQVDTGLQISQASETFGKFFRSYSELLSKFDAISSHEYVSKGIPHPVFYGLQTKEGQRLGEFHLVELENSETHSTSSVWLSDHRDDYRSCCWPYYNIVCTLKRRLGLYDSLSNPHMRRQGGGAPDPRPIRLLVGTHSAFADGRGTTYWCH